MAAGEPETAPAVRTFDSPADRKVIRLLRRSREHDGREARVIFPEAKPIIIFLLRCEWLHSAHNGMVRCCRLGLSVPGLNRGIPVIRRLAGFVVKVPSDPFGDAVVKTDRAECAPVEEHKAAAALHLPLHDLEMVAGVERMVLLFPVGAVRSQKDRVGVVER